ncbi:MAG: hypothetical protein CFE43_15690 [Burkholderiales bacterium PBB3]|nr:MAG: hypothetical protein CFE43_15690 [Burkholderiales bacterium PBB3]
MSSELSSYLPRYVPKKGYFLLQPARNIVGALCLSAMSVQAQQALRNCPVNCAPKPPVQAPVRVPQAAPAQVPDKAEERHHSHYLDTIFTPIVTPQ